MRILLQNSLFYPHLAGGTERSLYSLAQELSAAGHVVDILTTTGKPQGAPEVLTAREIPGISGKIYQAPASGLYEVVPLKGKQAPSALDRTIHHALNVYSYRWLRLTRKFVTLRRPDVLHTNNLVGMTCTLWRAAREHRLRIVHTIRDLHLLCPRTTMLRADGTSCTRLCWSCRLFSHFKLRATRQVDVVTSPSRYTLERHLHFGGFRGVRAEVVPNACEVIPAVIPDRTTRTAVQGLYLGSLAPHKGLSPLLSALAQLFADPACEALRFVFAGEGELKNAVEDFCRQHAKRCAYLGIVEGEAKQQVLRESDFVVIPSLWSETFGRVILDGFSYGLPVIGSDRGGIPEIIRHESDGQIVPPEPEALGKAMARYVHDHELRRRHGRRARERIHEFSLQKQVERFLRLYRPEGSC